MTKPAVVPPHTIRYYGQGEHCTDPAVGDLILVRHHGLAASAIRFGERLRCWGDDAVYARVNHAMTVVTTTGDPVVQEMAGDGGQLTPLGTYVDLAYAVVNTTGASDEQRKLAAQAALFFVGIGYGWPSIAGDVAYILTGIPFGLAIGQPVVCSTDASTAQRPFGFVPGKPDIGVLPSDLARWFDVRIPED